MKKRVNDTTLRIFRTENYINQNLLWVKDSDKSDQLLKYNQVLFNILEIHRRRLQNELHRVNSVNMARETLRTHNQNSNYEIKQFQNDTKLGTDQSALEFWDQLTSRELHEYPFELVPQIVDRNFGYGLNTGFGRGVLTGSISDYFTPKINFMYGFDVAYKNTNLFLNGTLSRYRVKRDYTEDGMLWPENLKTNVAILDVSIGQTLIDNPNHKITPFVGFGLLEITASRGKGELYEDHRITNYGLIYGLNYDYKFRKGIRLTPSHYGITFRERVEQNIRVKLYVTPAVFENMRGASINLTIGYSLFGRAIRVH